MVDKGRVGFKADFMGCTWGNGGEVTVVEMGRDINVCGIL